MKRYLKEHRRIIAGGGVLSMLFVLGDICWFLGVFSAVVGIISAVMKNPLVLGTTPWFLLAIAAFVASIPSYLGWAVAVYLHEKESKGHKEE